MGTIFVIVHKILIIKSLYVLCFVVNISVWACSHAQVMRGTGLYNNFDRQIRKTLQEVCHEIFDRRSSPRYDAHHRDCLSGMMGTTEIVSAV